MAIDYGRKRVGLAVTDPLQIIATSLTTVEAATIWDFLRDYFAREAVDTIVVGYPVQLNNEGSESLKYINPFLQRLIKTYPEKEVVQYDERFTSKLAFQTMIDSGIGKMKRRDKATVDTISATIILQSYMERKSNQL
ncbi:MAG: hypothetical protein RIS47_827 [Bacteroidota bacterium]|jgi:putative Holliday junction resolvase